MKNEKKLPFESRLLSIFKHLHGHLGERRYWKDTLQGAAEADRSARYNPSLALLRIDGIEDVFTEEQLDVEDGNEFLFRRRGILGKFAISYRADEHSVRDLVVKGGKVKCVERCEKEETVCVGTLLENIQPEQLYTLQWRTTYDGFFAFFVRKNKIGDFTTPDNDYPIVREAHRALANVGDINEFSVKFRDFLAKYK